MGRICCGEEGLWDLGTPTGAPGEGDRKPEYGVAADDVGATIMGTTGEAAPASWLADVEQDEYVDANADKKR